MPPPKVKVQGHRPDSKDALVRRLAADASLAINRPAAKITGTLRVKYEDFFLYLNMELSKRCRGLYSGEIVRPLLTLPNSFSPSLAVRRTRPGWGGAPRCQIAKMMSFDCAD